MRVRCILIVNPTTLERESRSAWVRIGAVYDVVEIHVQGGGSARVRIVDETGAPSLWPSEMFQTEDNALSGSWACEVFDEAITLAPTAFLAPGFWEGYFDGDAARRQEFVEVLKSLA